MHELCRLAGVSKVHSTFYESRTNGVVERLNSTLQTMLAKRVKETQTDWPAHLPIVVSAYRATVHEATGFSPSMLMLAREVRLPVDLLSNCPVADGAVPKSTNEFVGNMIDRVTENFEAARTILRRAAEVRKTQYDVKVKPASFELGDSVYYWYPCRYADR
jgi:transposase InsO family protein